MTLIRFQDQITDEHLHSIPNAEIWVFEADSDGLEVAVFDDLGNPIIQPLRSDVDGIFYYNAAGGNYENHVHYGGELRYVQQVTLGATGTSDAAYGPSWDGDTTSPPSKNAVYDEMETRLEVTEDIGWNVPPSKMFTGNSFAVGDYRIEGAARLYKAGSNSFGSWSAALQIDQPIPGGVGPGGGFWVGLPDGPTDTGPASFFRYGRITGFAFGGPVTVPDEAYGPGWNGKLETPTKNAVYDKIETIIASAVGVSDAAYGPAWSGITTVAPSKNAIYNKIETLAAGGGGGGGVSDAAYGAAWNGATTIAPSQNAVYDQMELRLPAHRMVAEGYPTWWAADVQTGLAFKSTDGSLSELDIGAPSSPDQTGYIGTWNSTNTVSWYIFSILDPSLGQIVKFNATHPVWFAAKPLVGAAGAVVLTSADKGVPGGVASLDGTGKVPSAQLPVIADDTAYGASWDGVASIPPSKNAVYDKIQALAATIGVPGTTASALTISNNGAGIASGGTFNGSAAITLSWNSIGAAPDVPRIQAAAAESITPTFSNDIVQRLACAGAITLNNPTGTAIDGWGLVARLRDNGTARAIAYGTQYRAVGVTLPLTTLAGKLLILGFLWNATDTKYDCVAVAQE